METPFITAWKRPKRSTTYACDCGTIELHGQATQPVKITKARITINRDVADEYN